MAIKGVELLVGRISVCDLQTPSTKKANTHVGLLVVIERIVGLM